ncbi:MAG: GNAT family N-acetyltransferase [Patescibacteria group bacterium]
MHIRKVDKGDEDVLKEIAENILTPLYGDQSKAFNEWFTGAGHKHAYCLEGEGGISGFVSLKADTKKTYLKISTLVVMPGHRNNGHGLELMKFAEKFARRFDYQQIIVTVSETKDKSLRFFKNNGFSVLDKKKGKYQNGVVEYVLKKEIV